VAIVTGAGSSGMGRVTAQLLARQATSLVVGDINEAGAQESDDNSPSAGGGSGGA